MSVECTGKAGFVGFGFLRPGEGGAGRSRKRLPKRKLQLGDRKDGDWVYNDHSPGAKMEIPAELTTGTWTTGQLWDIFVL